MEDQKKYMKDRTKMHGSSVERGMLGHPDACEHAEHISNVDADITGKEPIDQILRETGGRDQPADGRKRKEKIEPVFSQTS